MRPGRSLTTSELFHAHDGNCQLCGRPIAPGQAWKIFNPVAVALGGVDADPNRAPAHVEPCLAWQRRMTDLGAIACARHLIARERNHARRSLPFARDRRATRRGALFAAAFAPIPTRAQPPLNGSEYHLGRGAPEAAAEASSTTNREDDHA